MSVIGGTVVTNTTNGIQTDGSSGGNTVTIELTNKILGSATTSDGSTPQTLFTFPLNTASGATPGTYLFDFHSAAYNETAALSAGYETQFCVRWDGASGHLIQQQDYVILEEGAMSNVALTFVTSGANQTLVATGLAGNTINWKTNGSYIFVS